MVLLALWAAFGEEYGGGGLGVKEVIWAEWRIKITITITIKTRGGEEKSEGRRKSEVRNPKENQPVNGSLTSDEH